MDNAGANRRARRLRAAAQVPTALVVLTCLTIIVAGLKVASGFLEPVLLAFVITVVTMPLVRALVRLGLRRSLALSGGSEAT